MKFDAVRPIADAVLYEGYALYPYRASAAKNRVRFQWGVLVPPAYSKIDRSERSSSRTQCVVESGAASTMHLVVRFLHLVERRLQLADHGGGWSDADSLDLGSEVLQTWDDADEVERELVLSFGELRRGSHVERFEVSGNRTEQRLTTVDGQQGRVIRVRRPVSFEVKTLLEPIGGPYRIERLTVHVENTTWLAEAPDGRDQALRTALVGCHLLMGVAGGRFVSQMAPPEWARPYVETCINVGTYPVLVGDEASSNMMLSSPIILYDHPQIAPESPGNFFDATEIDELLTLRTITLTDHEKRMARGTDPRTAAIIDQADHLPPEMLDRLHGAIRALGPIGESAAAPAPAADYGVPWWNPGADSAVSPETDTVDIGGVEVARGARVRLAPRPQRADAQDMFLVGRIAEVQAVVHDVDGGVHLAVSLPDDPASEVLGIHGRFLYFAPDEVQPLELEV